MIKMSTCPQCLNEFPERLGQACSECEQSFCPACAVEFETCERCARSFCAGCAPNFIQIPGSITICTECYADYIEDTDYLFD